MLHVVDLFCPPLNLKHPETEHQKAQGQHPQDMIKCLLLSSPFNLDGKSNKCSLSKNTVLLVKKINFRSLKSRCFWSMKSVFVQGIPL